MYCLRKVEYIKYFSGSNSVETSYSMADELKHVLSYYKEEKHKVGLMLDTMFHDVITGKAGHPADPGYLH